MKCRNCGRDTKLVYSDYPVPAAGRPNVYIRDCAMYVCDSCTSRVVRIPSLSGFNAEVKKLPVDNDKPTYFAIDYMGTWFRLPRKEYDTHLQEVD